MKRLTREERRRIQRRAANIRFLAFVLILLALGVCIGYTAAHAQNACEPPKPQEVSQPSPVDDTPQEPAEQPAEDYSSLDRLELIGTFTAISASDMRPDLRGKGLALMPVRRWLNAEIV